MMGLERIQKADGSEGPSTFQLDALHAVEVVWPEAPRYRRFLDREPRGAYRKIEPSDEHMQYLQSSVADRRIDKGSKKVRV